MTKIVELANKKQEGGSIKDNLWVKEMLSAFGSPQAVYMSNRLVPMPGAFEVLTDDKLSSAERQKKLEELVKTKIIPPLLGGYAYYETVKGEGYYLLADYYLTPEQAKTAQPQIEGFLRNGASNKGKKPFSDSFEVISSETKGNLVLYKVKPKETSPLLRIVLSNELPVFWS
ncbi:MAG TPA: hypothetical protein VH186_31910 [Chloroflexia bacterium]|nr:hypothetical protein [Chloroflexia bacterium]